MLRLVTLTKPKFGTLSSKEPNTMKRTILVLIVMLFIVPASAQMNLLTGAGGKFKAAAPITFSLVWTAAQSENSGGTNITYNCGSSCSFGASDPNRIIVVFAAARMTTGNSISSVTVDGNTASLVTGTVIQQGGTNGNNAAMYQYALGSGSTSGNVVVNWSAATARTCVSIYRIVTGTTTRTQVNTESAAASPTSVTITKAASDSGIVGFYGGNINSALSWSNATSDYTALDPSSTARCGSATITASNPQQTSSGATAHVMSAATWGP